MLAAIMGIVGVLLGVLATHSFEWWRERRRWDEQYRFQLYGRRLEAHQQAFALVHRMRDFLVGYDSTEAHPKDDPIRAAMDWWPANCLYMDQASRAKLNALITGAAAFIAFHRGPRTPEGFREANKVWPLFDDALKAIEEGIGVKHLPGTLKPLPEEHDD